MSAHAIFVEFTPKVTGSQPKQWSTLQSLEQSAPWVYVVLEAISTLQSTAHADAGSNGSEMNNEAAKAAIRLLSLAPTTLLPEPSVSPIPGGGIGLHWRVGNRDLEVECGSAGRLEYLKTTIAHPDHKYEEGLLLRPDDKEFWAWLIEG